MKTSLTAAICTPLNQEESLHRAGLAAHLEEQWAAGIPSVLVAGSMGCMQLLRDDTYFDLVRHSVDVSRGRGEILVGVGDASFARTRTRIEQVSAMDIDGVVVIDLYLFQYSQAEQSDYYRALADVSRKPLFIYHLPERTAACLELDTLVSLSKHPNIRGVKCSEDVDWVRQLISRVDSSFRVMSARSTMMDVLVQLGVREFVDGAFSIFPQWAMATAKAAETSAEMSASDHQATLSEFIHGVLSRYPVLPACTAILNARGVPGNCAPQPMRLLDQRQREELLADPVVMRLQQCAVAAPPRDGRDETNGRHVLKSNAKLPPSTPIAKRPTRSALSDVTTGVIYRNASPHLRSIHAYFPSVVALDNRELIAAYNLGESFESIDLRLYLARSTDAGQTWVSEGPMFPSPGQGVHSDFGRLAVTPEGEIVANVLRMDRTEHRDESVFNSETKGFVSGELFLARSADNGHSWSEPEKVTPPLEGPEFEMCAPVTFLRNGQWLWPTTTWPNWQGESPHGNSIIAMVSDDSGRTWPRYRKIMADPANELMFMEPRVVEMSPGRLLAIAWCHDKKTECDSPNQYAVSHDDGATWSQWRSTGLHGQTMTPFPIDDTQFFVVFRRMDKPGLWVQLAHWEGENWINDDAQPLWSRHGSETLVRTDLDMAGNFLSLRFGAPHVTRLQSGEFFVSFWCYEDSMSLIRWYKFRIPRSASVRDNMSVSLPRVKSLRPHSFK